MQFGNQASAFVAEQRGAGTVCPRRALAVVRLRQGSDRHSRLVGGRCLWLAGTTALKVDCPLLARCWLETRAEAAATVTRGDDATPVAGLSCDELPPVFVHVRHPNLQSSGDRRAAHAGVTHDANRIRPTSEKSPGRWHMPAGHGPRGVLTACDSTLAGKLVEQPEDAIGPNERCPGCQSVFAATTRNVQ